MRPHSLHTRLTPIGQPWPTLALICIAGVAVLYVLDAARAFLLPTTAAGVLAVILAPVCRRLEQLWLPAPLAAVCTVFLALALSVSLLVPLAPAFEDWSKRLPQVAHQLEVELRAIKDSVQSLKAATDQVKEAANLDTTPPKREVVVRDHGLVTDAMTSAPALVAQLFYATVLTYFLLSERRRLRRAVASVMPSRSAARRLYRMSREIGHVVSRFLFSIACINVGLGIATGIVLLLFGVPNAALWGTGMAVLNFIPYLGPTIMLAIIFGAGIATFDTMTTALLPVAAVLSLNVLESQILLPSIVGRRVSLDPLAVFLAVAFWGWIWGVAGAIVAVPMTVIATTALRHLLRPALTPVPVRCGNSMS